MTTSPRALCALVIALVVAASAGHAQVVCDPNDALVDDLEVWELAGLTGPLSSLRPMPLQLVVRALQHVVAHPASSSRDRARAASLLAQLQDPVHVRLDTQLRTTTATPGPYALAALDPDLQGMVTPWLGFSSRARIMLVRTDDGLLLPAARGNPEDFIADDTTVPLGSTTLLSRNVSYGSLGVGGVDDVLTLSTGLTRHSYGPFVDNGIVLGPQAPVAGDFVARLRQPLFDAHVALLELSATDDTGATRVPGKHLFLHGIDVHATPFLDVGVFESVVTGRLELLYLMPAAAYFHSQGLRGFVDNSLVGATVRIRRRAGVELQATALGDDISFNDMVRGNFNTKYKFAAQAGVAVVPSVAWNSPSGKPASRWRRLRIDYTAVMPYVYTHLNTGDTAYNFEDYTNAGEGLGPALQPGSDRVALRASLRPLDDEGGTVDVDLRAAWIRHGNASAGIIDGADGSIHDPGWLGDVPTFQPPFVDPTGQPATRFLTQAVIEQTAQLGAAVRWTLQTGRTADGDDAWLRGLGSMTVTLADTWQVQRNAGLQPRVTTSSHFVELGLLWRY